MRAIRIQAEGLTASFRYPHLVQGIQPTYEMPPPATIYGHICSAVGELIDPEMTRFAYYFSYETRFFDYEHLHFFGKQPKMNPFNREMLFKPRLTLYLDNLNLLDYFRSPRYAVILGRAQDLMTYTEVKEVELEPAERAFYSGTLLPLSAAPTIGGRFVAATMPRFIDADRQTEWGQYALLPDSDKPPIYPSREDFRVPLKDFPVMVDSEGITNKHPYLKDIFRGVVWHTWR
jgi:CRISPR-associated protein Cas5t